MSRKSVSRVAYIQALIADLRDFLTTGGCSVFGQCSDASYYVYDFLRRKVPDIQVVYGTLAWNAEEPFAHWWNQSERLGLIIDAANPFTPRGFVGRIDDVRYRAARIQKLTRRDLTKLNQEYTDRDLDPAYYKNFEP